MIIRKPTKIELKPEEDQQEYEEFKKKQQLESGKLSKAGLNIKEERMSHSQIIQDSGDRSRMNVPNDFYRTPNNLSSNMSFDR